MAKLIDLTGQKIGRLTVLERAENNKYQQAKWLCRCDCGNNKIIIGAYLKNGNTKSCGCIRREQTIKRNTTHNNSKSRLYQVWKGIKERCNNPKHKDYKSYGEREINLCNDWLNDFSVFRDWAIQNGYDENAKYGDCTIDRIDTNKNYEPSNCRWITTKEQGNNKRNNIKITYNGKTQSIAQWSEELGIKYNTLYRRLNSSNWSIKLALTTK